LVARCVHIFEDSRQSRLGGGQQVTRCVLDQLSTDETVEAFLWDTRRVSESIFSGLSSVGLNYYWRPYLRPVRVRSSFTYSILQSCILLIAALAASVNVTLFIFRSRRQRTTTLYCPTKFGLCVALIPRFLFSFRIVFHAHNVMEKRLVVDSFQWLLRRAASDVICVSRTVYDSLRHERKILLVNPAPHVVVRTRKDSSSLLKIGVVASFFPYKGHDFFLSSSFDLLDKYSDLQIHLYGDGPELEKISSKFKSSRIYFHGRVFKHEDIYSHLNIVVVPSTADEAASLVITEAWAYGCVVIASDLSAHKELVVDGLNGYLFASGNSLELNTKLEMVINSRQISESLIDGGRSSLKKLNNDYFTDTLLRSIFTQL